MMVFNPVYIQKSNEGDLQLLGSGFSNQKPTHLFSDIIKVILSKTDQTENIIPINGKEQNLLSTGEYPLMITDSEVELFDSFMKMGLNNNLNPDEILEINPGIDWDNLKMFLNGLADKDGNSSLSEEGIEINETDLLVVLNIFAGNIIEQNPEASTDENIMDEIKNFISTVNLLAEQLSEDGTKNITIRQGEYSINLSSQENGKFLITLNEFVAKENVKPVVADVKTVDPNKTEPVVTDKVNEKVKTESVFANKAEEPFTKPSVQNNVVENVDMPNEDVNNIDLTYRKPEVKATQNTDSGKAKIAFVIEKDADVNPSTQIKVEKVAAPEIKTSYEFFEGKIKVDVKNVNPEIGKEELKTADVKLNQSANTEIAPKIVVNETSTTAKVEEMGREISQLKNTAKESKSMESIVEREISKESAKTTNTGIKSTDMKLNQSSTTEVAPKIVVNKIDDTAKVAELDKEISPIKETAKETKSIDVKVDSEISKGSTKTNNVELSSQNTVVDTSQNKKANFDKLNAENSEAEKISNLKQKSTKTVLGGKEAEQQKTDNQQNQNSFEKIYIQTNKAEQFGKEIKETVKVVEQSRLMNELENIIKSGERKTVTINLYPEELGSVRVSLDVNDKNISAKINVANEQVRQMILTQSENLKSSLIQNGIQLASLNVSVNNPDEKANPNAKSSKRKDGSVDKKLVIKDIPNPVKVKNLGYNTYDYVV